VEDAPASNFSAAEIIAGWNDGIGTALALSFQNLGTTARAEDSG
jgi:hypothetical protein